MNITMDANATSVFLSLLSVIFWLGFLCFIFRKGS